MAANSFSWTDWCQLSQVGDRRPKLRLFSTAFPYRLAGRWFKKEQQELRLVQQIWGVSFTDGGLICCTIAWALRASFRLNSHGTKTPYSSTNCYLDRLSCCDSDLPLSACSIVFFVNKLVLWLSEILFFGSEFLKMILFESVLIYSYFVLVL